MEKKNEATSKVEETMVLDEVAEIINTMKAMASNDNKEVAIAALSW
jgi:hypothetical protein